MSLRYFGAFLLLLLLPRFGFAQDPQTGNRFVTAVVNGTTGKVNIGTTEGGYYGPAEPLTFDKTSYLTVKIDDQYWTNNDQLQNFSSTNPQFGGYLNNGDTRKYADTIRTIWKVASGEIIQDVYPVAFDFSGQIVMRWKYHCLTYDLKTVRMQYLLDTRIVTNDKARVLTRYGYRNNWTLYTPNNANYDPIPTFYQAFQYDLDVAHNFNPGVVSQGTFIDPDLGLMKPDAVMVGDWRDLSLELWGWPQDFVQKPAYEDSGVLMQFEQLYAQAGGTIEIGSTSYGTGEFETCTGDLYGLIFRPRKLKPDASGTGYKPNPFTVDLYLFNTNVSTQANSTQATLKVGKHLTILDTGAINNRTELTQDATPKTTPVGSVSVVTWHVYAEKTCDMDTSYLDLSSRCNLADPSFNAPCRLPVTLPCLDRDTLPPQSYPVVSNGFVRQMAFDDNRPKDRGIEKVEILPYDTKSFSATYSPFAECTHDKVWVTATQLDSTVAGCIPIRVTDCAGNSTVESICFPKYPIHPDTIAPRFQVIRLDTTFDGSLCNMKYDSVLVVDDTLYDIGLDSIVVTPNTTPVNMALGIQAFPHGAERQGFAIHVLDSLVDGSISIRAIDRAGNYSDYSTSYCTIPDKNPPTLSVIQSGPFEWSVFTDDARPYDRKLDTISVHNRQNIQLIRNTAVFEPTRNLTRDQKNFAFKIVVDDTTQPASFCVKVKDLADSVSPDLDHASWWSRDTCLDRQPGKDVWPPNISFSPSPMLSPTSLTVSVDDIHYYSPSQIVGWDKGVDKVWFDNIDGYVVPTDTIYGNCAKQIAPFEIHVADSTAIKTISSVCMHVLDCAGNQTDTCLYYPVKPDDLAPFIKGTAAQRTRVDLMVSDSALYDRGLRELELVDRVNFDPFVKLVNGSKLELVPATTTNPTQSATARLVVTDLWGIATGTPADSVQHTSTADIAVWVQDLAMKFHGLAQQDKDFSVPVVFMPTDTFQLARKGITKFSFTFDLLGDPNFTYVGIDSKGYSADGWNITGNEVAGRVTITGASADGTPLTRPDTLLKIVMHSNADESTRQVTLVPISINGTSLTYNDAATSIVKQSDHATVLLPPPFGGIGGVTIVSQGACSPSVASNSAKPSVAMLGSITPNPAHNIANIEYGLPATGATTLIVYDGLGREITRLVSSDQTEGYHVAEFNAGAFPSGTYYVRLQFGDQVITRRIEVGK